MELEAIGLKVNLYSGIVYNFKKNQFNLLKQAESNDKKLRRRPDSTLKNDAVIITNQSGRADAFAEKFGELALAWAQKYKGDKDALPTP